MSASSLADNFAQPNPHGGIDELCARYRTAAERARRTGKPQIVEAGETDGIRRVERLFPIAYDWSELPRAARYWREREEAERLLHATICAPGEWWRIYPSSRMIEGEALRTGLAQIADLNPGEDVASHEPSNCPCFIWRSLTKEYLSLKNELAAAAGLREPDTEPAIRTAAEWARTKFGDYSELTKHLPWPGCLCVTKSAADRRGRPSLKRSFYLLAAEFIAVVRAG